jgi:hypothetical protein
MADSLFNTHLQSVLRQQVQNDASGVQSLFRRPSHSIFRGNAPGFLRRGGGWAIPARGRMAPIADGGYSRQDPHVKELTKSLVEEPEAEADPEPQRAAQTRVPGKTRSLDMARMRDARVARDAAAVGKEMQTTGKARRETANLDTDRAAMEDARMAATYNREQSARDAAEVGKEVQARKTAPVEGKASDASVRDLVTAGPMPDPSSKAIPVYLVDTGDGKPPLLFRKKKDLHKFYGARTDYAKLGGITKHSHGKTITLKNGHHVGAVERRYADTLSVNDTVRMLTRTIEELGKSVKKTKQRRQARGGKAKRALEIPMAPTQTPIPKTRARSTAVADDLIPWQLSPDRPSRKQPII